MGVSRLGLAAAMAVGLLAVMPQGPAQAAMLAPERAAPVSPQPILTEAAQDGPRFHHGKRAQSVYCLRRNYWWFYRPYTTAPEDFPRCEPYFHYPESAYRGRGARAEPYFK